MVQTKLLIVEDEFIVAADLQADLEAQGYLVIGSAATGAEALSLAAENRPDLALMDITLRGEMDGVETAGRLRREYDVPAIFLTAYADDRPLEKVSACEPLGYLVKPYEPRELRAVINIALYRMAMERQLRENRERLELALAGGDLGLWDWDTQSGRVFYNARWAEMLGYSLGEIEPHIRIWEQLVHPEDQARVRERLQDHLEGQTPFYETEHRLRAKNGEWVWVLDKGRVTQRDHAGRPLRVVGTHLDLTEKKRNEKIMREERDLGVALSKARSLEETLTTCLEAAIRVSETDCGGIYLVREGDHGLDLLVHRGLPDTFIEIASFFPPDSPNARLVLKGDAIYTRYPELITDPTSPRLQESLQEIGIVPIRYQHRVIGCLNVASHGPERIAEPSRRALERIALFIGSFIVQAQQEEKLRQSRADLETLFNTVEDLLFILDPDGTIIHCNDSVVTRLGFDREELIGKTVLTVHPTERHQEAKEVITAMMSGRTDRCQIPVRTKEERLIPVETRVKSGSWEGREVLIGVTRDVSERARAEAERLEWVRRLLLAQKRESLGTLAGAVAHRFNNLLGALMGNLELMLMDLAPESGIHENLVQAQTAARQAAELSRSMLTYVGQSVTRTDRIDVSRVVEDTLPLIKASLPGKVRLNQDLLNIPPAVKATSDGIRQILVNLTSNAWESLGEQGGEVSVTIGGTYLDKDALRETVGEVELSPGAYVFLEVRDTGCGLTEEVRSRMFDPFFSTKFPGRGMGLPAVWGLVRSIQGGLVVVSEPGKGTSVRVLLPAADRSDNPGPSKAMAEDPAGRFERGETFLLVEDDALVRDMARTMLTRLGLRVFAAKDGEEALDIFRNRSGEIDGLLCDLTMPGMSGYEVLGAVRALKPGVPFILSSGYEEAHVRDQNRKEQPQVFLHKPYRLADLRLALDRIFG